MQAPPTPADTDAVDSGDGTVDTEAPLTDDELSEMALAADPDAPVPDDAVPFGASPEDGLLPSWYMPAATAGRTSSRRGTIAAIVILAFLVINALGLCITYGVLEIA
jgi:hypothetical protein